MDKGSDPEAQARDESLLEMRAQLTEAREVDCLSCSAIGNINYDIIINIELYYYDI